MPTTADIEPVVEAAFRRAFFNLSAYLRSVLKSLKTEQGILESDAFNMSRIDQTIRSLRVQMDVLGYRQAIQTELQSLANLHQQILDQGAAMDLPQEFSQESKMAVRMLLIGAETDMLQLGNSVAGTLGDVLRRSILGGTNFSDLVMDIEGKIESGMSRAVTLAVSTMHSFNSAVRVRHAEENGIEWFAYLGPDDEITREWCDHWVGRRGRLEDFENTAYRWSRGKQPGPVRAWRGGYNCRHELVPVFGKALKDYPVGPRANRTDD